MRSTTSPDPGRGIGYGLLRYLDTQTGPELAGSGAAQLGFNYLGRWVEVAPPGSATQEPDTSAAATTTTAEPTTTSTFSTWMSRRIAFLAFGGLLVFGTVARLVIA